MDHFVIHLQTCLWCHLSKALFAKDPPQSEHVKDDLFCSGEGDFTLILLKSNMKFTCICCGSRSFLTYSSSFPQVLLCTVRLSLKANNLVQDSHSYTRCTMCLMILWVFIAIRLLKDSPQKSHRNLINSSWNRSTLVVTWARFWSKSTNKPRNLFRFSSFPLEISLVICWWLEEPCSGK